MNHCHASGARTLRELNRFASPSHARSAWQVVSTLAFLGITLFAVRWLAPSPTRWLLVPLISGLLTRTFVLQHDCGHHSLFHGRRPNDAVGTALSFITGIPYEPWRTEHAWHHTHQGQLEARGIDRVNSPMTAEEARSQPKEARFRHRLIRVWTVALLGVWSLTLKRKVLRGFFPFRRGFRWRIADPRAQVRGLRTTLAGHVVAHAGIALAMGPFDWAAVFLPAYFLGACGGALLFWVQHNFERTYHARDPEWTYAAAGLQGSSYLALPFPLSWLSADIGIHHVHHLHPRIPNYRLEEARRAIPELAALPALSLTDFQRCFSHVFWEEREGRMVSLAELTDRQS